MFIVVGLGNHGSRYLDTYHNIGFMVVDNLAQKMGISFDKEKFKSIICEGIYANQKVMLVKPRTFMNNSGEALALIKQKFKDARILVAVDDIDLSPGTVRYREKGSSGTHNGLRSIVSYIGEDFERVKIGIGRDESKDLAEFVLSKLENRKVMEDAIEKAAHVILEKIKS